MSDSVDRGFGLLCLPAGYQNMLLATFAINSGDSEMPYMVVRRASGSRLNLMPLRKVSVPRMIKKTSE